MAAPAQGQNAGSPHQHPAHVISILADGGSMAVRGATGDAEQLTHVRQHLQQLTTALTTGHLASPAHLQCVPGAAEIATERASITYVYTELPAGAELRMLTANPAALAAIHAFLKHHDRSRSGRASARRPIRSSP
jgi:hypothetical protein